MKILVTGGAGFIGSSLVDKLIGLGHKVEVIDNLSTGKKENLNPKAGLINWDISWDISEVYFNGEYDYVFHLAALPSVPYSIKHPTKTHRVNVGGTYNILKGSLDSKVKKVIFASSSAVYGNQELPNIETMPLKPESPYAFHKVIGEQYCKMFSDIYNLPTVVLRFFNVYGKRADPNSEYSLVIAKFLKLKKEGKPLVIYGDGEQTRDFVHVSDVVNALILAMTKPVENEVINICSGESSSINNIADIISDKKEYLPPRKGDVLHTLGNSSKAKRLLGWESEITIEDGIKELERCYPSN